MRDKVAREMAKKLAKRMGYEFQFVFHNQQEVFMSDDVKGTNLGMLFDLSERVLKLATHLGLEWKEQSAGWVKKGKK